MKKKTKPKDKVNPLTLEQAKAILQVKGGADVYGYGLAGTLRKLHTKTKDRFVQITKAYGYTGDGTDQMPYFGCIATKLGVELAKERVKLGAV